MKADVVTLSGKYQVVIPKAARQILGLDKPMGQRFRVEKVTDNEIVFKKDKTLEDFLGAYNRAFPKNAAAELRHQRDQDWEG